MPPSTRLCATSTASRNARIPTAILLGHEHYGRCQEEPDGRVAADDSALQSLPFPPATFHIVTIDRQQHERDRRITVGQSGRVQPDILAQQSSACSRRGTAGNPPPAR